VTEWATRVSQAYDDLLGVPAAVDEGFGPLTVDVPAERWPDAVALARDVLGCTYFDWLSAVEEPPALDGAGRFRVLCHLAARRPGALEHLLVRTLVPREPAVVPSVAHLFAGAHWHERETHEMFGIGFTADGVELELAPLLLPEQFEGHPLRKDFVLVARVARPWPGAKEPGESDATVGSRTRRRIRPPGVPDDGWGQG
jgi:NADH:ubiquinone oxidoreductase subunit C